MLLKTSSVDEGQKRTRSGRIISSTTVSRGYGFTATKYQYAKASSVCVSTGKRRECGHARSCERQIGENVLTHFQPSLCRTASRRSACVGWLLAGRMSQLSALFCCFQISQYQMPDSQETPSACAQQKKRRFSEPKERF